MKFISLSKIQFIITLLSFLLLLSAAVLAQQGRPDRGFHAGNTYALSDLESINTKNGNLNLTIPLASLPAGRGGNSGFTLNLHYNSKIWDGSNEIHDTRVPANNGNPNCDDFPNNGYYYVKEGLIGSSEGGWYWGENYDLVVTNRTDYEGQVQAPDMDNYRKNYFKWKVQVRYPDGSLHDFVPTIGNSSYYNDGFFNISINGEQRNGASAPVPGACGWNTSQSVAQVTTAGMNYYSTDGTFTRLFIPYQANGSPQAGARPWTLFLPSGTIMDKFPVDESGISQRITDRNGNRIRFDGSSIKDDLGRSITITQVSNQNDKVTYEVTQKGAAGEELKTQVIFRTNYVYRQYKAITALEGVPPGVGRDGYAYLITLVVEQINLPVQAGGQSYKFDYSGSPVHPNGSMTDGWGELKSLELPNGAKAEYEYQYPDPVFITSADVLQNGVSRKTLKYLAENDGVAIERSDVWQYSYSQTGGSVIEPNGSSTFERLPGGSNSESNLSYRTEMTGGAMVERIWRQNQPAPNTGSGNLTTPINPYVKTEFTTIGNQAGQPALTAIKDYIYDKNGNVIKVTEYDWVPLSSVPRQAYGGDPSLGRVTGIPSNAAVKRVTVNEYYNQTPDAAVSNVTDPNVYVFGSAKRLRNVLKSTEVRDASNSVISRAEFNYDDADNKGNLTQVKTWDSSKGSYSNPLTAANSVSVATQYDAYGNPTLTTDANGVQTKFIYGPITTPNGAVTDLYPTQTTAAFGTPLARSATADYDFSTGLVTGTTDVNGTVSAISYDALGRPLIAKTAVGTPQEVWTQKSYDDTARRVITRGDLFTKGDGAKVVIQHFDQLGRVRLARTLENPWQDATDETTGIKVQTRYRYDNGADPVNSNGAYSLVSNPYRAATSAAATTETMMGWSLSYTDRTGRNSTAKTFGGSALPAPFGSNSNATGTVTTSVDAEATTVTDQAGKLRRSIVNALGQLTRVDEPTSGGLGTAAAPTQPTAYTYDALGNLLTVTQSGTTAVQCTGLVSGTTTSCTQSRSFVYDSLSRLKSASNPESGTISYSYDANGNLVTKKDARNLTTTYAYDNLNRVVSRTYSDAATPAVDYYYDGIYFNAAGQQQTATGAVKGKLTSVKTATSPNISYSNYTAFDQLGRIKSSQQITDGQTYNFSDYSYNLAGQLVSQTYPSGRQVRQTFDADGDLAGVASRTKATNPLRPYAANFAYTAAGAVSQMQLGNNRWETTQFNNRLQPTQIGLGTTATAQDLWKATFDYGQSENNGNVKSQTIVVPNTTLGGTTYNGFTATQTYTYDSLNRLSSASETIGSPTWKQTFIYDRFGNRKFDLANGNTTTPALAQGAAKVINPDADPNTNKLKSDQDNDGINDYIYDPSGNLTRDANYKKYTYDGENKQSKVETVDGNGNVTSQVGQYVYDGDGKRIKKVTNAETTIFVYDASGKLAAEYSTTPPPPPAQATISYLTNDHLGSPRVITDATGKVTSRRDFLPFGEDLSTPQRTVQLGYAADSIRQKFTGYEKDEESGLNFAEARYQSPNFGRFMSPDPLMASARKVAPQTWNRYSYVINNPLNLTDPLGLMDCPPGRNCIPNEPNDAPNIYRYVNEKGEEIIGSDDDGIQVDSAPAPAPPQTSNPGSFFDPFQNSPGGPLARRQSSTSLQPQTSSQPSPSQSPRSNTIPLTATAFVMCHLFGDCIQTAGTPGNDCDVYDCTKDDDIPSIFISQGAFPQTAQHILDSQAAGHPSIVTIDRPGKDARRRASLRGVPTRSGFDRDEYPPAVFLEGGRGASVRYVTSSDNQGAGASMGNQLRPYNDGRRVRIVVVP